MSRSQDLTATLPDIEFVISVAKEAGELIRESFNSSHQFHVSIPDSQSPTYYKTKVSTRDLVTATDVAAEKLIVERIRQKYPQHQFLCEETSSPDQKLTAHPTWVIDPLDGTMNFVHGLPLVAVSIGYCVDGKPILGVVHSCIMDETFYSCIGTGSWLLSPSRDSGKCVPCRIKTTGRQGLAESIVALGYSVQLLNIPTICDNDIPQPVVTRMRSLEGTVKRNFENLLNQSRDLRRLGSCALELCYVASGRLDAATEIGVKEWDLAAATLIVREAGGYMKDLRGNPLNDIGCREYLAACSQQVADEMTQCLQAPSICVRSLEKDLFEKYSK